MADVSDRRDVSLCLSCPDAIIHSAVIPQQARSRAEEIIRENISRKTPLKLSSVLIIAGRAAIIASWLDQVPIRQKVCSPVLMMRPCSRPGHFALPLRCASRKAASSPDFTLNLTTL